MTRTVLLTAIAALALTLTLHAQPPAKTAETPAAQPPAGRPAPQMSNVRVDVTITEDGEGASPAPKVVTMLTADHTSGRVRSSNERTQLNIDVRPQIVSGRVRLETTVEYSAGGGAMGLSESLTVILEDGKPLVIAQSADPRTDRRVKLEVKATILK